MLDKHAFLCYTLRARKMQKEETGMEAHHRKVYLADLIARLYERLVREEQFLGDVTIFFDEEKLSIWEGSFARDYTDEILLAFNEQSIEEILAAYREYQGGIARLQPTAPAEISREEAERIARRKFPEGTHRFFLHPVDLHTQELYFTEDDPNLYGPNAWKVWLIWIPSRDDNPLPSTELFYIALPKTQPHIIQ
jgi:hypothetical protein